MAETRNMTAKEDTERICKRRSQCLREEDVQDVIEMFRNGNLK